MKQKDYRKYLKTRGPQTRRPASARAFKDKKTTLMIDILGSAIPNKRYKVHFDNRTTGARKRNPLKKKGKNRISLRFLLLNQPISSRTKQYTDSEPSQRLSSTPKKSAVWDGHSNPVASDPTERHPE